MQWSGPTHSQEELQAGGLYAADLGDRCARAALQLSICGPSRHQGARPSQAESKRRTLKRLQLVKIEARGILAAG